MDIVQTNQLLLLLDGRIPNPQGCNKLGTLEQRKNKRKKNAAQVPTSVSFKLAAALCIAAVSCEHSPPAPTMLFLVGNKFVQKFKDVFLSFVENWALYSLFSCARSGATKRRKISTAYKFKE